MDQMQCVQLRDHVFNIRFENGERPERLLRFVAVVPSRADDEQEETAATIHFAYAPAVWKRAGYESDVESVTAALKERIAQSIYAAHKLQFEFHDYRGGGWPLPWSITAKDSFDNFPLLVLRELPGDHVEGVLVRDSHCKCGGEYATFADRCAEPEEVEAAIRELRSLDQDVRVMTGWYKDCNITANSLEEAIAVTPESEAGQKMILLYRDIEWLDGIWNNPAKPNAFPLNLGSVADFHGIRASKAKIETRSNLESVLEKQTIQGDYDILEQALALLTTHDTKRYRGNYEDVPAVKALCDWWNQNAPEDMRPAAAFKLYIWRDDIRTFTAGDPEEPALHANVLAGLPAYAMFSKPGGPMVAINFYRGKAFNIERHEGTVTYFANGEEASVIGADISDIDEAYYSLAGLIALKNEGACQAIAA